VRAAAKIASARQPGSNQKIDLPCRSQAQKEKHPAISPNAAKQYQNTKDIE
jgi:hypothetical protein